MKKYIIEFILAFVGSYGPAVLFNIERKNLIWAGFCGASGWLAYSVLSSLTGNTVLSVFLAAVVISLYSEIASRLLKTPTTVFYIPSIFPLVPGIAAYNTVLYITENRLEAALYKAVETLEVAGAIAFGIMLVSTFFHFFSRKGLIKRI